MGEDVCEKRKHVSTITESLWDSLNLGEVWRLGMYGWERTTTISVDVDGVLFLSLN